MFTNQVNDERTSMTRYEGEQGGSLTFTPTPEPDTQTETEEIPWDLRLSFTPDAVREHFEGDEPDPTEGMSDEELAEIGHTALLDEGLYRAFHQALVWALTPDDNTDDNDKAGA